MALQQVAQPRVSRQLSQRIVFEALLHKGPISRADLSKTTGLSKQTVSEIADGFEQRGWIRQVGRTSGNIGRTAVLYELRPEGDFVVGIDLGGTKVTAAIADLSCAVLAERTEPTDPRGGRAVLDQIVRLSARLARQVRVHPTRIRSTVIGTPGVMNPNTGVIELAPNIADLGKLDVKGILEDRLGTPVKLENDVNLALLGEIWQGCAQETDNVAFIALGTGIGLGLSANGRLIRGERGAAGEIGYLPLGGDPFRPEVQRQGCLEFEVGAGGILRRYLDAGGLDAENVQQIFVRADTGEKVATDVIVETARIVALSIAAVAALFDPKLVVLGGSIGGQQFFLRHVQNQLAHCVPRPVDVRVSALRNRAGLIGALAVALNGLHDELFGVADLPDLPLPLPTHRAQVSEAAS